LAVFLFAELEVKSAGVGSNPGRQLLLIIVGLVIASLGIEFFMGRTITLGRFKRKYQIGDHLVSEEKPE
jgi:hypothetical protein